MRASPTPWRTRICSVPGGMSSTPTATPSPKTKTFAFTPRHSNNRPLATSSSTMTLALIRIPPPSKFSPITKSKSQSTRSAKSSCKSPAGMTSTSSIRSATIQIPPPSRQSQVHIHRQRRTPPIHPLRQSHPRFRPRICHLQHTLKTQRNCILHCQLTALH